MRAALIYQHATTDRDRRIADALGAMVDESRTSIRPGRQSDENGSAGVIVPIAK